MLSQGESNNINSLNTEIKPLIEQNAWPLYIGIPITKENVNPIEQVIARACPDEKSNNDLGVISLNLGKYHTLISRNYHKGLIFLNMAAANINPTSMDADWINIYIADCYLALSKDEPSGNYHNIALAYSEKIINKYENTPKNKAQIVRLVSYAHLIKACAVKKPEAAIENYRVSISLLEDFSSININILDDLYAVTKCSFANYLVRLKKTEPQGLEPMDLLKILNPIGSINLNNYFTLFKNIKNKFATNPISSADARRIFDSLEKNYWSKKDCHGNYFAQEFYLYFGKYFHEKASSSRNKNPQADYASALSKYQTSYNIAKTIDEESPSIKILNEKIAEIQAKLAVTQKTQTPSLGLLANNAQVRNTSNYGSINNDEDEIKSNNTNKKYSSI